MAGVLSSACTSARLLPACDTCSDLGWAVASPCHCGVRAAAGRRCFRVTPRARELPRSSASRPGPGRMPLKPGFTCVGTSGDAEYGNLSPEESSPSPRKLAEEALPREQLGMCSPSRSSVGRGGLQGRSRIPTAVLLASMAPLLLHLGSCPAETSVLREGRQGMCSASQDH